MRFSKLVGNAVVLGGVIWMAGFASLETRATQLLSEKEQTGVAAADFQALETQAAVAPSTTTVSALAVAYLDRGQPGLASAVIERAPLAVRERPEVQSLHARALFHRGHAREALAVNQEAQAACADAACPAWLVARTARQDAFFSQVVAAGIDDPATDPVATRAAYEHSTHQVRLVAMR